MNSVRFLRTASVCLCAAILTATLMLSPSGAAPRGPRSVQFGPDLRLSTATAFEPAIAANPLDPGNLVAGFFDAPRQNESICRVVFSPDGGATWSSGGSTPLQKAGDLCGDPFLAADALGNFYYAYLDRDILPGGSQTSDLVVAKSTDGGRSFLAFSVAAEGDVFRFIDKPFIAVDTQARSRFRGAIYASFDDFSIGIRLVVSRDGGATWSNPVTIAPFPGESRFVDGSLPVVAPDGTVYVFYADYRFLAEPVTLSIRFSKSKDGGRTWSLPADVASGLPSPGEFRLKNADPKFGTFSGTGIAVTSWPTAAIAPDGTIYVAWVDFPQGSCQTTNSSGAPCTNSDVRVAVSRDGGRRWTAPVKVSDETNATDQFFPWIAAHPDGLLSILWLDKRLDPDNENFDAFYTNTADGVTFLPNVKVSSATSIIGTTGFIGDYNGIAATEDGVFPVWNDMRLGDPAIFTARGTLAR